MTSSLFRSLIIVLADVERAPCTIVRYIVHTDKRGARRAYLAFLDRACEWRSTNLTVAVIERQCLDDNARRRRKAGLSIPNADSGERRLDQAP